MLIRVTGPNFIGGLIFGNNGRVAEPAPVVKWAQGMTADQVRAEAAKRGLEAKIVHTLTSVEIKGGEVLGGRAARACCRASSAGRAGACDPPFNSPSALARPDRPTDDSGREQISGSLMIG